ncbi:non-specific lipid-transfer protein 1 [Ricinus communis]|uniref:Non-specific lipid-transfer protein n=1 Tax=Ricinus communis TaxID=3988 RepID=B9T3P9_RICCO|nr:non-specific lipid-transfer protein 1 [Ricinus communis]EEF29522.1 Nonspecific lipid-transfer protein precursor, putative [Ricinus communis]|eukprot:XP_002532868.1 non-specific lipid-transfer protein 1 [Ricinus communis]
MATITVEFISCLVLCVVVAMPMTTQAITCDQVVGGLTPCIGYLMSGGEVSAACCNGVRGLNSAAKTTADRQQICQCFKSLGAGGMTNGYASSLPGKCNVNVTFKIGPSTDCNSIK